MRIVSIYPFFHRLGGIEKYILDLLPHQKKLPYKLVLLGGEFEKSVQSQYDTIKIKFIKKPMFLIAFSFSIMAIFAVRRILKPTQNSQTIIHAHGASSFFADVITAHSCHRAWFVSSLNRLAPFSAAWIKKLANPMHYLTMFIESIQYRKNSGTHIIAISKVIATELINHYNISPEQITVIHSGVDNDFYHPAKKVQYRSSLRSELGYSEQDIVVIFVANEFRRKGLFPLILALSQLNDSRFKLMVLGKDDPSPFRDLIESNSLSTQVTFIGPSKDVDQYYAASDIFALPTTYEPFGLVATEAMATGLPVVISSLAGAAELMRHGHDALLLDDPTDPKELALKLRTLQCDETRKTIGSNARESSEKFSWRHVADKIHQVYNNV